MKLGVVGNGDRKKRISMATEKLPSVARPEGLLSAVGGDGKNLSLGIRHHGDLHDLVATLICADSGNARLEMGGLRCGRRSVRFRRRDVSMVHRCCAASATTTWRSGTTVKRRRTSTGVHRTVWVSRPPDFNSVRTKSSRSRAIVTAVYLVQT